MNPTGTNPNRRTTDFAVRLAFLAVAAVGSVTLTGILVLSLLAFDRLRPKRPVETERTVPGAVVQLVEEV